MTTAIICYDTAVGDAVVRSVDELLTRAGHELHLTDLPPAQRHTDLLALERVFKRAGSVVFLLSRTTTSANSNDYSVYLREATKMGLSCFVYMNRVGTWTARAKDLFHEVLRCRRDLPKYVAFSHYTTEGDLLDRIRVGVGRNDGGEICKDVPPKQRFVSLAFMGQDSVGIIATLSDFCEYHALDILYFEQHSVGAIVSMMLIARPVRGTTESLEREFYALLEANNIGLRQNSIPVYYCFPVSWAEDIAAGLDRSPLVTFRAQTKTSQPGILKKITEPLAEVGADVVHCRVYSFVDQAGELRNGIKLRADLGELDPDERKALVSTLVGLPGLDGTPDVHIA